ncbi:DUF2254 domain-containing protein [Lamprobacter modestohalophilus]|uniref:DUF2254 domain-containing protein n=1 Tax=Lamprobacter modestohalophilus TaxID=1064514 RepID=UPI002ADEC04A|nr:DUF2254 domain-containing protein [Lamprobacter modestohalophilus]MEA1048424.1 DUF2254 domain-containing protein [Lamprobacter modestohalophilus]
MSWRLSYRLRHFIQGTLWITPVASLLLAMGLAPLLHEFDERTRWPLLGYGLEGANGVASAIVASTFTLTVLIFSIILVAVQLSSSQLSPRAIASSILKDRQTQFILGLFIFTYVLAIAVLGRIDTRVPELPLFIAIVFTVLSVAAFLYLIDYVAKALRPVSFCGRIAKAGMQVVDAVYPHQASDTKSTHELEAYIRGRRPGRVVRLDANVGVVIAFDRKGLSAIARRTDGLIVLVPQVGDFVARGEPVFLLFGGAASLKDRDLMASLVLGAERTLAQDPAFALRILVDIANKALSPGINDPTTAVQAIDYIYWMLREVGMRRLGNGCVKDETGALRLFFRTPKWEDFIGLAVTEVRHYGAGSIQIARRLRSMLQDLIDYLPSDRHPPLIKELDLLKCSVERAFADRDDWANAGAGDRQGQGSAPELGATKPNPLS